MTRALVFDSGIGGLSVLDAMAGLELDADYAADNAWLPYGEKSDADLRERVPALISALVAQLAPDLVVMACNTASTIALAETRAALAIPVVGVVPPIKPAAALSASGVIGLLATPATVRRPYTDDLIARFASHCRVVRVGSAALVAAAETKLAGGEPDANAVADAIAALFAGDDGNALDVVALACTHFPLLKPELERAAPHAVAWLDSGAAIARRVAELSGAPPGTLRAHNALFTDAARARALAPALRQRGFADVRAIGAAPAFRLDVLTGA